MTTLAHDDDDWSPGDLDDGFAASGLDFEASLDPLPPPPMEDDPWHASGSDTDDPFASFDEFQSSPTAASAPLFVGDATGADHPVPRITIHAFCERPDIAQLVQTAAADRRLAKANVLVEMGGVESAVTRLTEQASPNLILFDSAQTPANLLRHLDRLAEVVDPDTKVIVLGAVNDIALYRELMKRGVSEYVVPPFDAVQLIRTIGALYANPEKPFVGRLVSVIGAKGGVGASTVAHNLAWSLAERYQANTTLVDLDLSFGTTGLDFNQDSASGVNDALLRAEQLDEVYLDRLLVRHSERLALLPTPATLEREYDQPPAIFELLVERVRRTAPFVVLDLPHVWTGWVRQTILASDDLMIVTSPDLAGLRNCKNMVDLVRAARPNDPPPVVILNMVGVPKRPEIPHKDFSEALGLEPFISVPFDPGAFGLAANNGQPILEMAATSKPAQALDLLARTLCGREPTAKKRTSLLDKFSLLKR